MRPAASSRDVADLRRTLTDRGYLVLPQAAAPDAVEAAVRRLNLAIHHEGLTAEQIASWQLLGFFPHLRWEPEMWGVLPAVAAELLGWQEGDDWAEPQLLLRFPDEPQDWPVAPHVDTLPPWAADRGYRGYRGVVGVALTPAAERDGAVSVWPGSHRGEVGAPVEPRVVVPLRPGDALVMHPQLGHSGGLNLGPSIRMAIYFRLLAGG